MTFVARIVGGIVLVAIVVGIGLWAERQTDDDLALPDEVAGLAIDDSAASREFADNNSEGLSEAYDDAEAVTALYGPAPGPGSQLLVSAVRAKAGPPVPSLFTKDHDWVEEDDVQCLVSHVRKRSDSILCQRRDGDLTVQVLASGPDAEVDDLVDATNDVWKELS
jgi:hypothetical protein